MNESFKDLAYRILKAKGSPMNYRDLTKEVLKYRKTEGKTPHLTLRAVMYKDAAFVRVERGVYGLTEWTKKK